MPKAKTKWSHAQSPWWKTYGRYQVKNPFTGNYRVPKPVSYASDWAKANHKMERMHRRNHRLWEVNSATRIQQAHDRRIAFERRGAVAAYKRAKARGDW